MCRQIFAIIDCSQLKIQNEAFRDRLKMDWEMFFNRDDLMIYLVDDNPLRLIIRQSIMKLVSGKKNVRMFKELNAAVWSVLIQMMLEETDVRR